MIRPAKCITVEKAEKIQKNWIDTRADIIDRDLKKVDVREVVFSLKELEDYFAYVKSLTPASQINNIGIRVYFAAYGGNTLPATDDAKDHATVFLAPTSGNNKNAPNNYLIDPYNTGNCGMPPSDYKP